MSLLRPKVTFFALFNFGTLKQCCAPPGGAERASGGAQAVHSQARRRMSACRRRTKPFELLYISVVRETGAVDLAR